MKYLTITHVLRIHARSIEKFGGDPAIRDLGLLESAVAQPRAFFGGTDLYPDLAEKVAALVFSLVRNHPFADGNKRTGYGAMLMFLSRNGYQLDGTEAEHEGIFMRLAAGDLDRDALLPWIRGRIARK
jgi:death-on-curing protein